MGVGDFRVALPNGRTMEIYSHIRSQRAQQVTVNICQHMREPTPVINPKWEKSPRKNLSKSGGFSAITFVNIPLRFANRLRTLNFNPKRKWKRYPLPVHFVSATEIERSHKKCQRALKKDCRTGAISNFNFTAEKVFDLGICLGELRGERQEIGKHSFTLCCLISVRVCVLGSAQFVWVTPSKWISTWQIFI